MPRKTPTTFVYTPPHVHYERAVGLERAICGAVRYVTGDADVVTCPKCRRALARRLERHRAADPHCTCNDCMAHFTRGDDADRS